MKAIFNLIIIMLFVLSFIGFCMNVVKLINCDFQTPYRAEVFRSIGIIIPPAGSIIGWIDIGK